MEITDKGSSSGTANEKYAVDIAERTLHSDETMAKPITSPTINIPVHVHTHEENNISRRLSPKTTRKQMLATELSDSLRKSILWDRQYAYPEGKFEDKSETTNEKWEDRPKVLKKEVEGGDDWDKESFYARGW